MLKSNITAAHLIAMALSMGVDSVATGSKVIAPIPSKSRSRTRIHGAPSPAGSKLARKAAVGELTKCHLGLSPQIAGRFPFA